MLPGVGGVEYLVFAALIIIFVGPKDLPKVLKTVTKYIRNMRQMVELDYYHQD